MNESKKPRGRPRVKWKPIGDHLWHRLTTGIALDTVEAEARYLADWAKNNGILQNTGAALGFSRIRERIKRRFKGSRGYQLARQHHLDELTKTKTPT